MTLNKSLFKVIIVNLLILSLILTTLPVNAQDLDNSSNQPPAENVDTKTNNPVTNDLTNLKSLLNTEQTETEKKEFKPIKEELVHSSVYKGEVQINSIPDNNLTGEHKQIQKGTHLDLTVSTVLSSDTSLEGDEFFAEVSNDLSINGCIVVPMGSVVHGKVSETQKEKRLGRDGYVSMKFDSIITPDGREIPIQAELSTKSHPLHSFAKVALTDVGCTLVGGALGGLMALKLGGLGLAVASHGYTLAGGAAIGGTIGAAASLVRKGSARTINPGDQIKIKITSGLELPVIKKESLADKELALEGLEVNIIDYKLIKDPFGNLNTINLSLDIVNKTKNTFTFFDIALLSDHGNNYYPSPFGDTDMWFQKVSPSSKIQGVLTFSVDNVRTKHWLVFYDKYTRKPLTKISLQNAIRRLEANNPKNKKRS